MTKKEVATAVAKTSGLTIADSERVIGAFLNEVKGAVNNGDTVSLSGFGNFKPAVRAARKGFNPKTREEIEIPAKNVVKFVSSKNFINE